MSFLGSDPKLVELVQEAILAEIASGQLRPGAAIDPDRIVRELGVSRPVVQQAFQLLLKLGVAREAGRGLQVAPLDLAYVRNMYDMRAVIEGLAFREAAERNPGRAAAEGPEFIEAGRRAVSSGKVADMIDADMAFHEFIYELSANPLVPLAMASHWTNTQRVMGEVLQRDARPRDVWDEHEALLDAIVARDGALAEQMARKHIAHAAEFMLARLAAAPGN